MGFNAGENFLKGKVKGTCRQDLNNYRCPDCNSPFFIRGRDSYLDYVQCAKSDCLRLDLLPDLLVIQLAKDAMANATEVVENE
jgi:DNA-directed RNA polymerase subunit RPC12/RpoP